jgi:hypothetical protein
VYIPNYNGIPMARPYQAEVYDSRRIDRAFEDGIVSDWHQRFLATDNDPNAGAQGNVSRFRTSPDTGGPPVADEHKILPAILGLGATEMAMRPPVASWPSLDVSTSIDASTHILSNPLPTVLTEEDDARTGALSQDGLMATVMAAIAAVGDSIKNGLAFLGLWSGATSP